MRARKADPSAEWLLFVGLCSDERFSPGGGPAFHGIRIIEVRGPRVDALASRGTVALPPFGNELIVTLIEKTFGLQVGMIIVGRIGFLLSSRGVAATDIRHYIGVLSQPIVRGMDFPKCSRAITMTASV